MTTPMHPAERFRWGHNPDEINGPFDSVTMQGWMMQAASDCDSTFVNLQCRPLPCQGCFSDERRLSSVSAMRKTSRKERWPC